MAEPVPDIVGLLPHRACRNCMQIKVKCVVQKADGDARTVCERCHRLGKQCTTPAPVLRKRRKERSSKVAQLEDRINQLTHLLTPHSSPENISNINPSKSPHEDQSQRHSVIEIPSTDFSHSSIASVQPATPDPPEFSCSNTNGPRLVASSGSEQQHEGLATILAPPHLRLAKYKLKVPPADFCPMYLDQELENSLFESFRDDMSPAFPFVIIPADANCESVKKDRPFVYWSACAVASYRKRALQGTLNNQLLKSVGEQILSKAHKSPDVLQGILILTAWNHYHSHLNPQIVNLLHLAQALIVDLGFSRPLNTRNRSRLLTDLADMYHGRQVVIGIRSSDDRRALLGAFVLASRMALCFQRCDPMRYTQHIEDCCQQLEESAELASDLYLVSITRLHKLAGRYLFSDPAMTKLPSRYWLTTLFDELDAFKNQLPRSMITNVDVLMEIEICKFTLLGPTHLGDYETRSDAAAPLYAALKAMKDFMDHVCALSPVELMAMSTWFSITYLIGAWAELCFLQLDSWDLKYVREVYNFTIMMQGIADQFEACQTHVRETTQSEDLIWRYALYGDKVKHCVKWYEAKIDLERRDGPMDELPQDFQLLDGFTANLFDEFADPLWDNISGDWTRY